MPPDLISALLVILILSQLLYSLLRWGGGYVAVLLLTAAGIGLGQLWRVIGLPGIGLGDLNLLPGVVFAVALRSLAGRWPATRRGRHAEDSIGDG
ncbi:MAG: hypothetical protein ACREPA_00030 [Candidatus Dormibacteraceae bacterium]